MFYCSFSCTSSSSKEVLENDIKIPLDYFEDSDDSCRDPDYVPSDDESGRPNFNKGKL